MKKLLFPLFILAFLFFRVAIVSAGVVTYPVETNILLTIPNITLVVQAGSSADSVIVNGSTIVVTVSAPDSFSIRSDNKYSLSNDGGYSINCGSTTSTLTIQPNSGQQTVIITPTVQTCTSTVSSSSSSNSSNSQPSAPSCGDQAPGAKAPLLYGAITQDSRSVLLYFTEADNPVNKYVLEYGTQSGSYSYGVQDMGVNSRSQMTFLVKSLLPNTTYYFKVRGGNGCATGPWSNEISAKTKGLVSFNQLDITNSQLVPKVIEETSKMETCQTYTVKSGDTLWTIAKNLLGDGNKYKEIIEQNKDEYQSLETSSSLKTGWELKVNCGGTQTPITETQPQAGYDVKVKVVDTAKKPVEGATITLHSTPQTTKTDKNGIATFKNVEQGEHRVLITYNNYSGEQTVNLTGEVKEFDLNITIQQKAVMISPLMLGIVGFMGLVIVVLLFLLIRSKKISL